MPQGYFIQEKWNKIFRDLSSYLLTKGFICVYDFSSIKNFPNYDGTTVSFVVTPGAKIVPVRKAFITANKILNEWDKVKSNPENERWAKKVNLRSIGWNYSYSRYEVSISEYYNLKFGLFDESGYCIKDGILNTQYNPNQNLSNIMPQKMYFAERDYGRGTIDYVLLEKIPDDRDLLFKPIEMTIADHKTADIPIIMSIDEYNEWAKEQ